MSRCLWPFTVLTVAPAARISLDVADEHLGFENAVEDSADVCHVGAHVKCPNSNVYCSGSQCCPDGSTCPSSEALHYKHCPAPKVIDCTSTAPSGDCGAGLQRCDAYGCPPGDDFTCFNPETHQCIAHSYCSNKVCALGETVCGGECKREGTGVCCGHSNKVSESQYWHDSSENRQCCQGRCGGSGCETWDCDATTERCVGHRDPDWSSDNPKACAAIIEPQLTEVGTFVDFYDARDCSGSPARTVELSASSENRCNQCWDRCAHGDSGYPAYRLRGPGTAVVAWNCIGKFHYDNAMFDRGSSFTEATGCHAPGGGGTVVLCDGGVEVEDHLVGQLAQHCR